MDDKTKTRNSEALEIQYNISSNAIEIGTPMNPE
jgi:hypothetical protein